MMWREEGAVKIFATGPEERAAADHFSGLQRLDSLARPRLNTVHSIESVGREAISAREGRVVNHSASSVNVN
jgi:hypothetical protein